MKDYQGNTDKSKEKTAKPTTPEKKIEKVVTGDVIMKQKPLGSRFKHIFFGGDVTMARDYVISEVLLPALRNLISEAVAKGTDRLVFGESSMRRRPPTTYGPRVQYHNPLVSGRRALLPDQSPVERWTTSKSGQNDDVIVSSKGEAEAVVDQMITIVDQYQIVSVADLNELLGMPSSHVDNNWGWTNLESIEIKQVREGFKISFPPLEDIR
jgi:hypothetical protein